MVDRTLSRELILTSGAVVKIKRTAQTDYSIIQKVVDDTVTLASAGGDPQVFEALDGGTYDIPTKITSVVVSFPVWLTSDDIELYRLAHGEPTVTGTAPYEHSFDLSTLPQDMDIDVSGTIHGDTGSGRGAQFTGSAGSVKFDNLSINKGAQWKYQASATFAAENCRLIIKHNSDLS